MVKIFFGFHYLFKKRTSGENALGENHLCSSVPADSDNGDAFCTTHLIKGNVVWSPTS